MTFTFKLSRRLAVSILSVVVALVLVGLGFFLGSFSDGSYTLVRLRVTALLNSTLATKLLYLIVVAIGCAAGRVFPFQRDFQGSRDFLKHMFPRRTAVFYERTDFFVSCVMGSMLGMLIVRPASIHAALLTGLGWPFIVRFVLEGMKTIGRPPENGGKATPERREGTVRR